MKSVEGQLSFFDDCIFSSCMAAAVTVTASAMKGEKSASTQKVSETLQTDILKKIKCYGPKKKVELTENLLKNICYTDSESENRLLIQKVLDSNKGVAGVSYGGNTVYPSLKLIREFKKMQQNNAISKMSDAMYKFLSLNFDIAHYDKYGYIDYYDGRYDRLYEEVLKDCKRKVPNWRKDVITILDAVGI